MSVYLFALDRTSEQYNRKQTCEIAKEMEQRTRALRL